MTADWKEVMIVTEQMTVGDHLNHEEKQKRERRKESQRQTGDQNIPVRPKQSHLSCRFLVKEDFSSPISSLRSISVHFLPCRWKKTKQCSCTKVCLSSFKTHSIIKYLFIASPHDSRIHQGWAGRHKTMWQLKREFVDEGSSAKHKVFQNHRDY